MPAKPKSTKRKPSKEQLAEQYRKTMQAGAAARTSARRQLCSVLRFWKVCRNKQCRRARACAGNVDRCFDCFWPVVPDVLKIQIRAAREAHAAALPKPEIAAAIKRATLRWRETQASAAAAKATAEDAGDIRTPQEPSPQTPAIVRSAPRLERNPRVRVL
jgi:hypothetical protein